jgi:hypothetical protein
MCARAEQPNADRRTCRVGGKTRVWNTLQGEPFAALTWPSECNLKI